MGLFKGGLLDAMTKPFEIWGDAVKNRTDKKYGTKEQELAYNYDLSMNDKQLIGKQGVAKSFGDNMLKGITGTFGSLAGIFGGGRTGGANPMFLIGIGAVILLLFIPKKSKRKRK